MKKVILGLMLLIGGIVLVGCTSEGNASVDSFNTKENVYAVSAVAGVDLVDSNNVAPLNASTNDVVVPVIDTKHIDTMLSFINDEAFSVEELVSDNDEYALLIRVTLNNDRVYDFYFNEVLITDVEEVEEDEDDNDDTEIEVEQEFTIIGIIIENGITYNVEGTKEVESETDGNEVEEEFSLELKISLDEDNYTIVKYETELETENKVTTELEKEYKIAVYVDGKKVSEMEIDFEQEGTELEVELKIKEDGKLSVYNLETNEDNTKATVTYMIKKNDIVESGTVLINIITDSETGIITYEYEEAVEEQEDTNKDEEENDVEEDEDAKDEDEKENDEEDKNLSI